MEHQVFFDDGRSEQTDWKKKGAIEKSLFYFLSDKNMKTFNTIIADNAIGNKCVKALVSKIQKVERSGLDVPAIIVHSSCKADSEVRIEVRKSVQKMGKTIRAGCKGRDCTERNRLGSGD